MMRKKVWLPRHILAEIWKYGTPTDVINKLLEKSRGDYIGWDFRPPTRQGDTLVQLDIDDGLYFEAIDAAMQYNSRLSIRAILYYTVSNGILPYYLDKNEQIKPEILIDKAKTALEALIPQLSNESIILELNNTISILEEIKNTDGQSVICKTVSSNSGAGPR